MWRTRPTRQGYAAAVPFPRKLLNDNEDIVLDLHPHWWFFAPPMFALAGSVILGLVDREEGGREVLEKEAPLLTLFRQRDFRP